VKIYFLRHGKAYERAEWSGKDDNLRPLTPEGIDLMKQEAKSIERMKLKLDVILTSPLVRAYDTAKIVAKTLDMKYEFNELLGPDFDRKALQEIVNGEKDNGRLMIVGHEPSFSRVISDVIGGGSILLRKGGLARVDITQHSPLKGDLVWLLTPDTLTL
jgi:phosphohistidine phosphatase